MYVRQWTNSVKSITLQKIANYNFSPVGIVTNEVDMIYSLKEIAKLLNRMKM